MRAMAPIQALLAVLAMAASACAHAQSASAPDDFELEIVSRPTHLFDELDAQRVTISPDGSVFIKQFRIGGENGEVRDERRLTLGDQAMASIYTAVAASDFFSLDEEIVNYQISGGDQATLTITANGRSHSVTTVNMPQDDVDSIAAAVNAQLPETHRVYYNALVYPQFYEDPPTP